MNRRPCVIAQMAFDCRIGMTFSPGYSADGTRQRDRERTPHMSIADHNSPDGRQTQKPTDTESRFDVPWWIHINVWIFIIAFSLSPLLWPLLQDDRKPGDRLDILFTVVLLQGTLWFSQRLCSSPDLSYWEGLLVAAASKRPGVGPLSWIRTWPVLFEAVAGSFVFAVMHEGGSPMRNASIRYRRLIICIYRRRQ
jgi:hypothetical protein